ncbi:RNA-directed DNA polymerase, eukaryota, reverse transcriptase zinc-binding domain protein [Tanacetum coccineum]
MIQFTTMSETLFGDGVTEVSHFFYADDAVFLCDWSLENVRRGTTSRLVVVLTEFPFEKITRWKTKTLSIGGRLTLIKSILGSIESYFMSLFPAPNTVLKDLEEFLYQIRPWHRATYRFLGGPWAWIYACAVALRANCLLIFALDDARAIDVQWAKRLVLLVCLFYSKGAEGGVETEQWEAISALIQAFAISPQHDKLRWTLDSSDEFSVSPARYFLDGRSLFSGGSVTFRIFRSSSGPNHEQNSSLETYYRQIPFEIYVLEDKDIIEGGRLTLIKSILGNIGSYFMSLFPTPTTVLKDLEGMRARFFWGADVGEKKLHWVSWSRVMASRLEGGLGVGSLFSLNRAMLFKWFWRFFHNPNALWVSVIRALHGHCGRLRDLSMVGAHSGPWKGIISALIQLKDRGDGLQDFCQIRVGNGQLTDFWRDTWLGSTPLFLQFSRIFALDDSQAISVAKRLRIGWVASSLRREPRGGVETEQWEAISALIQAFVISPQHDKLRWTLDSSDEFSVSPARYFLDGRSLFSGGSSTRWNNFVPIKLNILLWRIGLAGIPTRDNLVSRGIVLNTSLCPVCCTSLETVEHVFAMFLRMDALSFAVYGVPFGWWNVPIPSPASVDSFINWADQSKLSVMQQKCFDVVICTAFWVLWNFRNSFIVKPRKSNIFDDIVSKSFFWLCNQRKNYVPLKATVGTKFGWSLAKKESISSLTMERDPTISLGCESKNLEREDSVMYVYSSVF